MALADRQMGNDVLLLLTGEKIGLMGRMGPIFMSEVPGFIPPHGNYKELRSYQKAEVVYDITYRFCQKFLKKGDRTVDQMVQAARSGKQNIVEGVRASGGPRKWKSSC